MPKKIKPVPQQPSPQLKRITLELFGVPTTFTRERSANTLSSFNCTHPTLGVFSLHPPRSGVFTSSQTWRAEWGCRLSDTGRTVFATTHGTTAEEALLRGVQHMRDHALPQALSQCQGEVTQAVAKALGYHRQHRELDELRARVERVLVEAPTPEKKKSRAAKKAPRKEPPR